MQLQILILRNHSQTQRYANALQIYLYSLLCLYMHNRAHTYTCTGYIHRRFLCRKTPLRIHRQKASTQEKNSSQNGRPIHLIRKGCAPSMLVVSPLFVCEREHSFECACLLTYDGETNMEASKDREKCVWADKHRKIRATM